MKSVGTNPDLWFASIDGQTGFVSSKFLKESKMVAKNQLIVKPVQDKRSLPPNVEPNKVKQHHEVIEGTTIYSTEATPIVPAQEPSPIVAQPALNEDATPALEVVNEENITMQPKILTTVEKLQNIPEHDRSHINKQQPNSQKVLEDLDDQPELMSQGMPLSSPETFINNEPDQLKAMLNKEIQDLPEQTSSDFSNETPMLEIVPQPQALLSTSGDSVSLVTTVQLPETSKLIQDSQTRPEAQESDQNKSLYLLNNIETITANDILSETKQVPQPNELAKNSLPEALPALDKGPGPSGNDNGPANSKEKSVVNIENGKDTKESTTPMLDSPTTEPAVDSNHYIYETTTHSADFSREITTSSNLNTPADQYMVEATNEPTTVSPTESTAEQVHYEFETSEEIKIPESTAEQVHYESETSEEIKIPKTESTLVENKEEGFFSNVYTTISDIWPSTTEAPPTTETIFNTEDFPAPNPKEDLNTILEHIKEPKDPNHIYHSEATREPETAELKIPVNNYEAEGFSFVKYFTSVFLTILGTNEETKALFTAPGTILFDFISKRERFIGFHFSFWLSNKQLFNCWFIYFLCLLSFLYVFRRNLLL